MVVGRNSDNSGIKKGPWSAEEDEILKNFVNRYGPTDWSSIRSNGLLPRTGKSCRLRWVNKLRPNLKVGCKFTAEEERVVVDLQAKFGNKWAKIASYLEGRTDNDVKNFWSSRQKRLARMLLSSSSSSSHPSNNNKFHKQNKQKSALVPHIPSNLQVSNSSNSIIQVTEPSSPTYQPLDQSPSCPSNTNSVTPVAGLMSSPPRSPEPTREPTLPDPLWLPQLPASPAPLTLRESPSTSWFNPPLTASSHDETKDELVPTFDEPNSCLELFPGSNACNLNEDVADIDFGSPFFGGLMEVGSCSKSGTSVQGDTGGNLGNPDCFFEDFPTDVFDSLDPLLPEFVSRPDCRSTELYKREGLDTDDL